MKKIVYICDKCGVEIQNETYNQMPNEIDLCARCQVAFSDLLEKFLLGDLDKLLTEPEPEKPKKGVKGNGGARHKVKPDLGKVGALYAAGWTVKQIAEEMNCSDQTIRNHLNEAVQAYKEVMEEK